MVKQEEISRGKTKTITTTQDPSLCVMKFRDDTTAFNAEKKATLADKGKINNAFNAHIMQILTDAGIENHFVERLSVEESLVKRLDMLPLESVIRNVATGSLCRRLGLAEGRTLNPPIQEFFYKDDGLGDPLINESHIESLSWATRDEIQQIKSITSRVNDVLKPLFLDAGLLLVDFKIEFGRYDGRLLLGDEFTPDGCRIWDVASGEKLDKDRFRQDLGDVVAAYRQVAVRLGVAV